MIFYSSERELFRFFAVPGQNCPQPWSTSAPSQLPAAMENPPHCKIRREAPYFAPWGFSMAAGNFERAEVLHGCGQFSPGTAKKIKQLPLTTIPVAENFNSTRYQDIVPMRLDID